MRLSVLRKTAVFLALTSIAFAAEKTQQAGAHHFHHPEAFVQSIAGKKDAGKKVYHAFCVTCHAKHPLVSMGAPRKGVKEDWQKRMKKDVDAMVKEMDAGFGAMPPRGGCFECSDAELKQAIEYMLPKKPTVSLSK